LVLRDAAFHHGPSQAAAVRPLGDANELAELRLAHPAADLLGPHLVFDEHAVGQAAKSYLSECGFQALAIVGDEDSPVLAAISLQAGPHPLQPALHGGDGALVSRLQLLQLVIELGLEELQFRLRPCDEAQFAGHDGPGYP